MYHGDGIQKAIRTDQRSVPLQDCDLANIKLLAVIYIHPIEVLGISVPYLCDTYNILQYVVSTGRLFIIFSMKIPHKTY